MKQAATAVACYRELQPSLHGRQLFVRQQLEAFIDHYKQEPTAKELLVFVASRFPQKDFDLNSVRPRLTEMHEQGWVCHAGKRLCTVTNKRVYTWGLSTPKPPALEPVPQRLNF